MSEILTFPLRSQKIVPKTGKSNNKGITIALQRMFQENSSEEQCKSLWERAGVGLRLCNIPSILLSYLLLCVCYFDIKVFLFLIIYLKNASIFFKAPRDRGQRKGSFKRDAWDTGMELLDRASSRKLSSL